MYLLINVQQVCLIKPREMFVTQRYYNYEIIVKRFDEGATDTVEEVIRYDDSETASNRPTGSEREKEYEVENKSDCVCSCVCNCARQKFIYICVKLVR